jgi:ATP-dependent RNA helicase RhlE
MASVLIFSRTKHGADRVARDLERDGFEAAVIHGNKSQNARQKALNGFREGSVRILVATDIAARGIDVPGISHVVNFDLPDEPESYVHRIGRTGRNGASGVAITLCDPAEGAKLRAVERVTRKRLAVVADHTGQPDPKPAPREAAPNGRQAEGNRERNDAPRHAHANPHRSHGDKSSHGKPAHGRPDQRQDQRKPFRGKRRFGGKRPNARAA